MLAQFARVVGGPVDERGLAPAQERHPIRYIPGASTMPPLWRILPLRSSTHMRRREFITVSLSVRVECRGPLEALKLELLNPAGCQFGLGAFIDGLRH